MQEDAKAPQLRLWCLRVRSLVLTPRSDEGVEQSRPLEDGSLSPAMQTLIEEARKLDISELADVEALVNSFYCMSWCILATACLRRKPSFDEVDLLMSRAKDISFPEEKALRMIKGMHGRAKSWQTKVMKELTPVIGEKKCFNVAALKDLEVASEDIPMRMKEETLVAGVIEDKGARHCICGGPSDARVMLNCDRCEKWFHGPCVKISKEESDGVGKWMCPACSGSPAEIDISASSIVCEKLKTRSKPNVSPEAPDPFKLWPPFGLFNSKSALEVLGEKCSAIPDVDETYIEAQSRPSGEMQSGQQTGCANPELESGVVSTNEQPGVENTSTSIEESEGNVSSRGVPEINGTSAGTDAQSLSPIAESKPLQQSADLSVAQSGNLSELNAVALAAGAAAQQTPADPTQAEVNVQECSAHQSMGSAAAAATASRGDQPTAMDVEHSIQEEDKSAEPATEVQVDDEKPASPAAMDVEHHIQEPAADTQVDGEKPASPAAMAIERSHLEINQSEASPSAMEIEQSNEEESECNRPTKAAQVDEKPTARVPEMASHSEVPESEQPAPPVPAGSSQITEMPQSETVVSDAKADGGTPDSSPTPSLATTSVSQVPPAETASNSQVPEKMQSETVVSAANAGSNTSHSPPTPTPTVAPTSQFQVPPARETLSKLPGAEILHSENTRAGSGTSHNPPTPTPSRAPTSESPDQNVCGIRAAPTDTSDDIVDTSDDIGLSSSAQLNPATMNVMVPALPVQDSGN